MDFEDLIL